jgi:hypothetical protein
MHNQIDGLVHLFLVHPSIHPFVLVDSLELMEVVDLNLDSKRYSSVDMLKGRSTESVESG